MHVTTNSRTTSTISPPSSSYRKDSRSPGPAAHAELTLLQIKISRILLKFMKVLDSEICQKKLGRYGSDLIHPPTPPLMGRPLSPTIIEDLREMADRWRSVLLFFCSPARAYPSAGRGPTGALHPSTSTRGKRTPPEGREPRNAVCNLVPLSGCARKQQNMMF